MTANSIPCPTLGTQAAADFLGVEPQTLAVWRTSGRYGLPFIKVGRVVRYRITDLQRFLEQRTVGA
jgi:predicted site-specific integrase-resolvase